jgi:hypothetical protein
MELLCSLKNKIIMKTIEKNRYRLPELDDYVAQQLAEIRRLIVINAETYATRNLPPPDNQNIRAYFAEDHQKFQGLVDEVNRHLQIKTSIHEVTEHKGVTEHRLQDVRNQQAVAKEHGHQLNTMLQNKKAPYNKVKMMLAYIATAILCLGDGIYNIQVFSAWGSGYAEAVLLGLFFAFLILIVAHCFKWIISFGTTIRQKRTIALGVFAVMLCLFTYMAIHRAAYLEQQTFENSSVHMSFSAVPFVLLSMLIFSVSVILNCFYTPTREQRNEMCEYQGLQCSKCDNDAELCRLKDEAQAIDREYLELRQLNASVIEYGMSLELIIMAKAREGLGLFKKHNMMHRKDHCRPPSFDDDGYPFDFGTNFQPI